MKSFQFYLLLILLFLLYACKLTNSEVTKRVWKYGEGFYLGDIIEFDEHQYQLVNDTIIMNGEKVAGLVSAKKQVGWAEELIVFSLKTKQRGTYYMIHEKE